MDRQDKPAERLRPTFERNHRPDDAQGLKTVEDWKTYSKITKKAEKVRAKENKSFHERFATRVARETKRLIANGGVKNKDLTYSLGSTDKFNPAALRGEAERIVTLRNAQRLSRIDIAEASMKLKLSKRAIDRELNAARTRMEGQWREASRGRTR